MDFGKLTDSSALIFDFDGTICHLFKNYNLSKTVILLREKMKEFGVEFSLSCDTFDVFSVIKNELVQDDLKRHEAYIAANYILTNAETEAVNSCEIINGVVDVLPRLIDNNYKIGIATNNSVDCVKLFLKLYCNGKDIPIVGRVGVAPKLMKPNPWSILNAISLLNCKILDSVLIGDTARDYLGSVNAGCAFIGMASTPIKRNKLMKCLVNNRIVSDFYELAEIIQYSGE